MPFTNDVELMESGLYKTRNLVAERTHHQKGYLMTKRVMDILVAIVGILLYLPVFLVIGILIKLEEPRGSILFKQQRVGKNGKLFYIYKVRSMVPNAEELRTTLVERNEIKGALFKIKDDPRITRIGKLLRRTSLDEIPQLWNVLKGDMSLVGPRPSLPVEVEQYSLYDRQRLLVIPGCTGLWQVRGRNSIAFEEMVEMDLDYIQRRCLSLDIRLILKTFWVMLYLRNS